MSDDKTRGRQEGVAPSFNMQIRYKGEIYEYPVRTTQTAGIVARMFWQHVLGSVSRLKSYTLVGEKGKLFAPDKRLIELGVKKSIVYGVTERARMPNDRRRK